MRYLVFATEQEAHTARTTIQNNICAIKMNADGYYITDILGQPLDHNAALSRRANIMWPIRQNKPDLSGPALVWYSDISIEFRGTRWAITKPAETYMTGVTQEYEELGIYEFRPYKTLGIIELPEFREPNKTGIISWLRSLFGYD